MEDDVEDLVSRLLALLTARLEDCAIFTTDGQGRAPQPVRHERALDVEARVRDAHLLPRRWSSVAMRRQVDRASLRRIAGSSAPNRPVAHRQGWGHFAQSGMERLLVKGCCSESVQ